AGLLLPALARAKEKANRTACLSNCKQMGLGSMLYAEDDSEGRLTGSLKTGAQAIHDDDDRNWLYGLHGGPGIKSAKVFVNPSTRNNVDPNDTYDFLYNGSIIKKLRE